MCTRIMMRHLTASIERVQNKYVTLFKYDQQDATLYNILYYFQRSTCFRGFLRPLSRAQKLYTQHRVYANLTCYYR